MPLPHTILAYNTALPSPAHREIAGTLAAAIDAHFAKLPKAVRDTAECKIWHRHPVWFLDGNPIVGYSPIGKDAIRLMFWSGQSFDEPGLPADPPGNKFKSAGIRYTATADISAKDLKRWLKKSIDIQWDYKNIVKRKGKLVRLK
ncbi:MAG: DUF1801 domain-containing protein [Phycisphaeraceae bacterium]|nr:DUF1801 domain-containing protein [Phycisphaeraceae bacterium]